MTLSSNYGAAPTYVKIASTTLTATTSTITFSNIPQGYTDLRVVIAGNQYTSASYGDHNMRYNSDSGSNYSNYGMYSNTTQGTTPIANYSIANQTSIGLGAMVDFTAGSNTWVSHSKVDIMSYSNTTAYKSCLVANSMIQSGDYSRLTETVGTWRSTAAITSISFHAITDPPFNVGVTVNIYGIKAALVPKASGGDIIVQDGSYWYHAFRSTSSFTPKQALTCDYLVVAGGGGGSYNLSSGAGAGGYRSATSQSFSSGTIYTMTIGAGGTAGAGNGTNGNASSISGSGFTTFSASGGGRGSAGGENGISGGSGGGAPTGAVYTGGAGNAGGYTPVEGYAGGATTSYSGVPRATAGGGGAGAVGQNSAAGGSGIGGIGGAGSNAHASWLSVVRLGVSGYLAGGGGGTGESASSAGGAGGGGASGAASGTGIAGAVNTGGGGGGGGNGNGIGGAGGSGLIIVRYPI